MKPIVWLRILVVLLSLVIITELLYIRFHNKTIQSMIEVHTCPICDSNTNFYGFGNPPRPSVMCSKCKSLERHRLIYLYLTQKTNLFEEKASVLHFSPNFGLEKTLRTKQNLRYITADLYGPADLKLDLTNLKLPDECFDVVICSHVLEHIVQDRKAISEIFRILKPSGWAIILVPASDRPDTFEDPNIVDPKDRQKYYGRYDHVRWYGHEDFPKRLKEAGFEVTIVDFTAELEKEYIEKYGLTYGEKIYRVRKPI